MPGGGKPVGGDPSGEPCLSPTGLYLPKEWADDAARRAITGVPDDICFQTQPEIALQQLRQVLADGVPPAPVLIDPAYGNDSKLRAGISELGLDLRGRAFWPRPRWFGGLAKQHCRRRPERGRGRPGKRLRRDATHQPVAAKTLALELDPDAWQTIKWRDGSNTPLTSRFARWRGASGARRRHAERTSGRRVAAADRMAGGRGGRTGPLLACHAASRHLVRAHGRPNQTPLADRARLP